MNRDRGAFWKLAGLFGTDRAFGVGTGAKDLKGKSRNAAKLNGCRETVDTFFSLYPNICLNPIFRCKTTDYST